ncbi:MAG TPA: outer membrane beta-barrel protein [Pedobacter sp.]|nr:outer membrane beta-barrel protein [Pedobacter sp.]
MKPKLLMMAILLAIGYAASAQIEKGNSFGGGSISFGTSNGNSNSLRLNSLAIGPKVGYFVNNRFAIGIELSYNLSKLNGESYDYFNENTQMVERGFGFKEENFGLAPFARYYFPLTNNFMFFGQANIVAEINSYKNIDDSGYLYRTDYSLKGFGASLNPGFAFYPSPKWMIEFSFPVIRYFKDRHVNTIQESYFGNAKSFHLVLDNFTPSFGVNFSIR